ncbi:MAG TPA: SGNH/GDSL hydrolase family protein [Sorangium sp.]|nr:SGNH/GDSL hydrolase family protein [Sorangium sp.]
MHVGDSMADALGKDLKRELEKRGVKNPLKYKEATYIPQWAGHRMRLASYLAYYKPDMVIVTLGGNETAMPDPTVRADPVRRIVKMIGDRPCLWVAAPLWPGAPNTGILKVVRDNCAPCIYVDTNTLMTKMKVLGDGVHPTLKERKRWAKFMVRWLLHNRDPKGKRIWDFKVPTSAPPAESVGWLDVR